MVWDGKTLAADKMNIGKYNTSSTITKIRKINGYLYGASGNTALMLQMFEWFEKGADPGRVPPDQLDSDKFVIIMRISPDGSIHMIESSTIPIPIEEKHYAIGAGEAFARGAMEAGADAYKAVAITNKLDILSGNGIDTLTFDEESE